MAGTATKSDTIILHRKAGVFAERFKANAYATRAAIWKGVLGGVCCQLIDNQAHQHGFIIGQLAAVGFAFDHERPTTHHLLEILAQLVKQGPTVNPAAFATGPEAPMDVSHYLDLLNRRIQD